MKRIPVNYGEGRHIREKGSKKEAEERSRITVLGKGKTLSIKPSASIVKKMQTEKWEAVKVDYVQTNGHGYGAILTKCSRKEGYNIRYGSSSPEVHVPVRGVDISYKKGDVYCNDETLSINEVLFYMPTSITLSERVVSINKKA